MKKSLSKKEFKIISYYLNQMEKIQLELKSIVEDFN
jgi:hypothetical protein